MRRILIATEGSPCSDEAVRHFVQTMGVGPTEAFALCVIPPVKGYHTIEQAEHQLEEALMQADQALSSASAEGASAGLRIRSMRRVGDPVETILLVAKEISADLIVLGTHGPEGLANLAGSSVAEGVLREAQCGVVIFPWHPVLLAPTAG